MDEESTHGDDNYELVDECDVDEHTELEQGVDVHTSVKVWNKKYGLIIALVVFCIIVGCVAAILYSYTPSETSRKTREPWSNLRLPKTIYPRSYDLVLDINMENDSYTGNVVINLHVANETEWILFNKVELTVTHVAIYYKGRKIEVVQTFFHEPNEIYVLKVNQTLQKGENYTLDIQFNNTMSYDLSGLYTSAYSYEGNKTRKIASTFFSPISARKAFPCFDEPVFKANFTLTLTHSDTYHALSNMPTTSTVRNNNGLVTTKFDASIKMSTYIVAWVISDFESVTKIGSSKPEMKAWAQKDKLSDLQYGLNATSKLLRFYENYFNISFPLAKLDTVAIPNLAPGAMENWGAIFYRSHIILYDAKKSTEENKQEAFNIIAHELVHQWFGNLVTMEYWTDAWLKEGFANNIAIIGGDRVDKSMELGKQVLTNLMLPAMDVDSYSLSHPISTSVKTPSDVRQVFNVITYNKGSCIVEIILQFLGPERFRKGLQKYLKVYSYKNAEQDDLWKVLSDVSGKDVKSVMDTWTLQLGYPVVFARRINDTFLEIQQKRFSLDVPNTIPPKSPFDYIWKIPIVFFNPINKKRKSYLLTKTKVAIPIPKEYSILNPDHSLFYRVHYDKTMLGTIKQILMKSPNLLSAQDRTGLISDQFNFVADELMDTDIGSTLDILKYLKDETDYFPWKVALDYLSRIHSLIEEDKLQIKLDSFIKDISTPIIRRTTWGLPKSANEGSLQILILEQACKSDPKLKNKEKIEEADILYNSWVNGTEMNVRPSLFPVIRDCAISHGPGRYWEYAFNMYKEGGSANKESLLMSLTATTRTETIKKLLNYSLDGNIIETQDAPYIVAKIAGRSKKGKRLCWDFMKKHWDKIIKTYGDELFLLANMLQEVLEKFSTDKDLSEITKFFKNKNLRSGSQAYEQSINKIKSKIQWKKTHLVKLDKWLNDQGF